MVESFLWKSAASYEFFEMLVKMLSDSADVFTSTTVGNR